METTATFHTLQFQHLLHDTYIRTYAGSYERTTTSLCLPICSHLRVCVLTKRRQVNHHMFLCFDPAPRLLELLCTPEETGPLLCSPLSHSRPRPPGLEVQQPAHGNHTACPPPLPELQVLLPCLVHAESCLDLCRCHLHPSHTLVAPAWGGHNGLHFVCIHQAGDELLVQQRKVGC